MALTPPVFFTDDERSAIREAIIFYQRSCSHPTQMAEAAGSALRKLDHRTKPCCYCRGDHYSDQHPRVIIPSGLRIPG